MRPRPRSAPVATWRTATAVTGGLVLVAIAARLWLMRRIPTPWILVDEFVYSEYAKSFAAGGHFLLRGELGPQLGRVYPALISPAWHFGPMSTVYAVAKGINVVVMSLVVVPVFLWARRLVSPHLRDRRRGPDARAAGLRLHRRADDRERLLPARSCSRSTHWRSRSSGRRFLQLFLLVSFGLAVAVRVQAIVLIPIFVTALVLKILFDVRSSGQQASARPAVAAVRPYLPSLGVIVVAAVVYALWKVAQGVPSQRAWAPTRVPARTSTRQGTRFAGSSTTSPS